MSTESSTEAKLIAAAASGNMGAFSDLVCAYRARVLRVAYGLLGSADEAEDVAQEVFVKLWNCLSHHRSQVTLSSWLYRVTVNAAIDALRKRRHEVSLDDLCHASREAPEEAALRRDVREQVEGAIRSLPESARAALILREYEQLSYQEIAEVLQIPIGTVMSRLNYARQSLRKTLSAQRS